MIQPVNNFHLNFSAACWLTGLLLCGLLLPVFQGKATHVQIKQLSMLDAGELEKVWATFSADTYGNTLAVNARRKGFARQSGAETAWGFRGLDNQGMPLF
ncbi:hypothetical protein, partial [Arsenicibacter rosenii]|uniref:hypothetical protein n=1 Tax=Arsenicibacter rosenii TaxID=1750698 RepID=UPI0011609E24